MKLGDIGRKVAKEESLSSEEIEFFRLQLDRTQATNSIVGGWLPTSHTTSPFDIKKMRVEETAWRSVVTPTVGTLAYGTNASASGNTFAFDVVIPAKGNDRCVLVAFTKRGQADMSLGYCRFNGVGMTLVDEYADGSSFYSAVFKIMEDNLPAAAGTYSVTVGTYYAPADVCYGAVPLTGVEQATPLGTSVAEKDESITVTGNISALVVDFDGIEENATNTAAAGQTTRWSQGVTALGGTVGQSCSTKVLSLGSTTMAWTGGKTAVGHIGVAVNGQPVFTSVYPVSKMIFPVSAITNLGNETVEVDLSGSYPPLVNPSVVNNFVSFSTIAGAQKDSGYSASSFQPIDATLTSIALLGTAADKMLYTTGADTWAEASLTAAGRAILDDATAADQRTTLGLGAAAVLGVPIAANYGGTGIANLAGSTLTLGAATSITGGGTIGLGGFTLTVPATGTAVLGTGTANQVGYWSGTNTLAGNALFTYQLTANPNLLIQSDNAARVAVDFRAAATQSANIVNVTKSDATVASGFDSLGRVFSYGNPAVTSNFFAGGAGNAALTGTDNVGIGDQAGGVLTSSSGNFLLGSLSGWSLKAGSGANVYIGYQSGYRQLGGTYNIGIGGYSGRGASGKTSSYNICIGGEAGYSLDTGGSSVMIGFQAGRSLTTAGNCIFIGVSAGYNQTTTNRILIIDSTQRASAALEVTNAIIYGVMAATPAAQTLALNAVVKTGGRRRAVNVQTTTYTATVADEVIICNSTTAFTVTLPAATGSGQTYRITNINTGTVTVDGNGSELVKGSTAQNLYLDEDLIITDVSAGVWA